MNKRNWGLTVLVAGLLSASLALLSPAGAFADATDGDLFYTTFSGLGDRVFTRPYVYDGVSTITYGTEVGISGIADGLGGADGIVFDPTDPSFLLIGGQNDRVYRVEIATGAVTASDPASGSEFHLSVPPSVDSVLATGIPGTSVAVVDLTPFGSASTLTIGGSVSSITGLAFDGAGNAYYTSSGPGGTGSFGTAVIGGGTVTTTELFSGVEAAHGLVFDPFTGHFLLSGGTKIAQYDPVGGTFVSSLTFAGNQFDQGTADGKGHYFAASNFGNILFVDYASTGKIGTGFTDIQFFKDSLDDVAPLSGPGSQKPVPEPASVLLFGLGGLTVGLRARRKLGSRV